MVTPRTILFKAKRLDNGEWIEGYYSYREWVNGNKKDIHFIHGATDEFHYYQYEIDPTTLCENTGITDRNNNWIWENDIVIYDDELWTVNWSDQDACFTIEQLGFIENFGNIWGRDCEVYGNIFDNEDLLHPEDEVDE